MDTVLRLGLFSGRIALVPAVVEKNEHCGYTMPGGNVQIPVYPVLESFPVGLPEHMMQENPHAVEAEFFCPSELAVYRFGIESVFLPHFELVYGVGRNEIATCNPIM